MKNPTSKAPKILAIVSFGLLIITLIGLTIFTVTLEENTALRTLLTNIFSNDPKAQRENLDMAVIENTAVNTIVFLKKLLIVPIGYLGLLSIVNGVGLFCMKRFPCGSAVTFIILGALSFFTIIPPILLVTAGIMMLRRLPDQATYRSGLA